VNTPIYKNSLLQSLFSFAFFAPLRFALFLLLPPYAIQSYGRAEEDAVQEELVGAEPERAEVRVIRHQNNPAAAQGADHNRGGVFYLLLA